ncbi:hypothetical protein KK060_18990 [Fulvivirgaceae bacterium PWU20]|uniref:Uncharacterized protein n=1 Tax=Chryseosolibacter indicus TaxID=2782351 RepID=A0ABS5VVD3_9BACT|nr:hypothetical protein [Chryseosolibacter indicus]
MIQDFNSDLVQSRGLKGNYVTSAISPKSVRVPAGDTYSVSSDLILSSPLPVGCYLISIENWRYPGFSFTSVLNVVSAKYMLSGSILGEDGVPITEGELFLYRKNADGVVSVENRGH